MIIMENIKLNNGIAMPLLGFGVFQITDPQVVQDSVLTAMKRRLAWRLKIAT